jgi:hypothetical protein
VVGPSDGRRVVSVWWSGVAAGTPALAMAAGPRLAVWTPDAAAWGRLVHGDAALEDDAAAGVAVVENAHGSNITDMAWAVGDGGSRGYVLSSTVCRCCMCDAWRASLFPCGDACVAVCSLSPGHCTRAAWTVGCCAGTR